MTNLKELSTQLGHTILFLKTLEDNEGGTDWNCDYNDNGDPIPETEGEGYTAIAGAVAAQRFIDSLMVCTCTPEHSPCNPCAARILLDPRTPRCPDWKYTIVSAAGCGSTRVTEPDEHGIRDCGNCGVFFPDHHAYGRGGLNV
jgi:hypothetical protein